MRHVALRLSIAGALFLAVVAVFLALFSGQSDDSGGSSTPLAARFEYLSSQRSNRCDLQADALMRRRTADRLQGACCSPMKEDAYTAQVRALRRYAKIGQIPTDPYDVAVGLAQQLLRYRTTIALSATQGSVYREAMAMSDEKGPCCCHCWRWNAFEGLSRYLVAERHWGAPRLARLIDALDGCGGDSHV